MAYKQTGDELGNKGLQSAHCASRMANPSQIRFKKNECNDAKTFQTYRKFNVWDVHMPALLDISHQQTKSAQNKMYCVQILDPS